jgi:regulatory protein
MELEKKISVYADSLKIPNYEIKSILDDLEQKDWLSDQRFTEQFVFSKKRKFGMRRIARELNLHGVDELIINKAISAIKEEEFLLAKQIWKKKYNQLPDTIEEKAKQIRFMQSRGIEISTILQILSGKSPEIYD